MIAPDVKPLMELVVDYLRHEGFEAHDCISLEIPDNLEGGARNPRAHVEISRWLDTSGVDAVVLPACVQMPSLASIQPVEDRLGLPVVSAAVCTVHRMLERLGLAAVAPNVGALLSGRY